VAAEVAYELKMLREDGVKHICEGAPRPMITALDRSQYITDSTDTADDDDTISDASSATGSGSSRKVSSVPALLRAGMLKDKFEPIEGSDGTSFTLSERELFRLSLPLGCTLRRLVLMLYTRLLRPYLAGAVCALHCASCMPK
jgi:hypothetical protein